MNLQDRRRLGDKFNFKIEKQKKEAKNPMGPIRISNNPLSASLKLASKNLKSPRAPFPMEL
jgi:hypothetical protein